MGLVEQDFIVQLKAGVVRCRCPTTYGATAQFLFVVVVFFLRLSHHQQQRETGDERDDMIT